MAGPQGSSRFEVSAPGRAAVSGPLSFATAAALLPEGERLIQSGPAGCIDLSGVSNADSAGLALLVEWLSLARAAGRTLSFDNIPAQLLQLARLSDLDALLTGGARDRAAPHPDLPDPPAAPPPHCRH